MRIAAHSLKSACRNVGLSYLADIAEDLEVAAERGEVERATFLIGEISENGHRSADILTARWAQMIAAE